MSLVVDVPRVDDLVPEEFLAGELVRDGGFRASMDGGTADGPDVTPYTCNRYSS